MLPSLLSALAIVLSSTPAETGNVAGTNAPFPAAPTIRIGSCRVRSFTANETGGRKASNMFVIDDGRRRILVDPLARTSTAGASAGSLEEAGIAPETIDLVLLTRVEESTALGLLSTGFIRFPNADVLVDAWDLERAQAKLPSTAMTALATYTPTHRLHTGIPNAEVVPGVRIRIPPGGIDAGLAAQIACGSETLLVWNGSIGTSSLKVEADQRDMPAERRRFLTAAANENMAIASTTGEQPGIGRVYHLRDGFHWGSIDARSPVTGLARPSVTVEVLGDDQH